MQLMKYLQNLDGMHQIKHIFFDKLPMNTIINFLKRYGITPNHITLVNIGIGLIALVGIFNWPWYVISFLLTLHFFLDNLDGYYARTHNLYSKLGDLLDHGGDFLIGCLFLWKNSYVYNLWWMWLSLALYVFTAVIIIYKQWQDESFPSRINMIGYLFGSYYYSMLFQLILQPAIFIWFLYHKFKTNQDK